MIRSRLLSGAAAVVAATLMSGVFIAGRPRSPSRRTTTTKALAPAVSTAKVRRCADPIRIMPLGDSLTGFPDSYRGPLYRKLVENGFRVDFVGSLRWPPTGGGDPDGEGHGGYTIGPSDVLDSEGNKANLFDNVESWFRSARPDVVILSIGHNDIATGGTVATDAPKRLQALIERVVELAPNAEVLVGDIAPSEYHRRGVAIYEAVSNAARTAAADPNDHVAYVPTFNQLLAAGYDSTKQTADGTHFNASGGTLYGDVLYPSVVAAIERFSSRC